MLCFTMTNIYTIYLISIDQCKHLFSFYVLPYWFNFTGCTTSWRSGILFLFLPATAEKPEKINYISLFKREVNHNWEIITFFCVFVCYWSIIAVELKNNILPSFTRDVVFYLTLHVVLVLGYIKEWHTIGTVGTPIIICDN